MKKIVFLILTLSITFLNMTSNAQSMDDWELQQTGTTDYLWGIQFLDSLNGWAVGNSTVIHTNDGGQSWIEQDIDIGSHYLWEIFFTDSLHGWTVGGYYYNNPYGAIFHTDDGGQNWALQYQSDEFTFYGIYFTDSLRGWVVGGYGPVTGPVILYTDDGGVTWEEQFTSTTIESNCIDVFFYDDSTGWVVGSDGMVLNTTNGGNTWNIQNTYIYNYIRNVQALSTTLVYACGTSGLFLFTYDGGNNWHHIPSYPFESNLQGLYFLDSLNGWIVGDVGSIYYTTNGGMNWTHEDFGFWEYFHDIFFTDSDHGWIVGMDGMVYHTLNGGGLITDLQEPDQNNLDPYLLITPNPFYHSFELLLNINKKERVQICLYDMQGNLIEIIQDQQFLPGQHRLKVDKSENLPDGIYLLKFHTASFQKTMKIAHIN